MVEQKNTWVKYVERTYQQIKDSVLVRLQSLTPEITDHTESNIFVKMLGIWAGIAEMLGYYIDNVARESYISTCRLYWSAVKIAQQFDYRIFSKSPASADVTFTINTVSLTDITIPQNTELKSKGDLKFLTVEPATINVGQLEATVSALQFDKVIGATLGISNGSDAQVFVVNDQDIADKSAVVKILGSNWAHVDTFAFSLADDLHFRMSVNIDKQTIIEFGDGINGAIPQNGATITLDYLTCAGAAGNIAADQIAEIVDTITLPPSTEIEVTNNLASSGGVDIESLDDLKRRIPLSIRTVRVAVTEKNFLDIANQAPQVQQSALSYDCGKNVKIYVVPIGGGIASEVLCDSVVLWFEDKKLFSTKVFVFPAGMLEVSLNLNVQARYNYQNIDVQTRVVENLEERFSMVSQGIGGKLKLSDIYEVVENTDGVEYSNVRQIKLIPYARSIDNFIQLDWTKTLKDTGNVSLFWKITMINPTQYQLFKGSTFQGTYDVGTLATFVEIDFVVNLGAYNTGDEWEFVTYPSFQSNNGIIELEEFSVPVILQNNTVINVTGGI